MEIGGLEAGWSDLIALIAVGVSLLFYRQNRSIAADSRTAARAAEESARTAREAVEDQRREMILGRKACLAVATDKGVGGIAFSQEDGGFETAIKVFIRNEGKESAYNIQGFLIFDGKTRTTRWGRPQAIGPGSVDKIEFYFPFTLREYDDMPFDSQAYFQFRADYRDGVGADSVTTRFRFEQSSHPMAESGFPYWETIIRPEDTQRSELCRPLAGAKFVASLPPLAGM